MSSFVSESVSPKRPEDRTDYDVDFGRNWMTPGDTIESVLNVAISGDDTAELDGHDFTDTVVKVWLKGGTAGRTVTVTVEVKTRQGREKEITFQVRVRARD